MCNGASAILGGWGCVGVGVHGMEVWCYGVWRGCRVEMRYFTVKLLWNRYYLLTAVYHDSYCVDSRKQTPRRIRQYYDL
jgi:hypothetical protein